MVNVIYGDDNTFDAIAYGVPHPGTVQYLTQRFEQAGSFLQGLGQAVGQRVTDMFQTFNSSEAIHLAQAALRKVSTLWDSDIIRPLASIAEFQHAQPQMIRWIMAEPTLRTMYHNQEVDGYSDYYVDAEPNRVGDQHYDWRRAMDGFAVINETDDLSQPEWYADSFIEDLEPDDGDLSLIDQSFIQDTWVALRQHLAARKDDPTSRFNAQLD